MNTIFIQFYEAYDTPPDGISMLVLENGFSDTMEICKSKGDFIWVNLENEEHLTLPIKKGKAYVCGYFINHLLQTIEWAKENPDVQFIIGGPVILTSSYIYEGEIWPSNVEATKKTVEEYFGVQPYPNRWELDISGIKERDNYDKILFSYTINTDCYWGKCIYCNYHFPQTRIRKIIDYSPLCDIDFNGIKQVKLNSPTIPAKMIEPIFGNMICRDDIRYDFFLRSSLPEREALKIALDKQKGERPYMKFIFGAEFPSNHLLHILNKGFQFEDVLQMLEVVSGIENSQINVTYMSGFPMLTRKDIDNLNYYVDKIPPVTGIVFFRLFCKVFTELHELYKHRPHSVGREGDFYRGYIIDLTDEEMDINIEAQQIMDQFPCDWMYYAEKSALGNL